jgi:hypothetical protein
VALPSSADSNEWGKLVDYAVVRIRQAVEFRQAARQCSLLTSPLPLYYSFLNLTRAFLALKMEAMPTPKHGIQKSGDDSALLLGSRAKLVPGTTTELLAAQGVAFGGGLEVSLQQCLRRIIEIAEDVDGIGGSRTSVVGVKVDAFMSGKAELQFGLTGEAAGVFRATWKDQFPKLRDACDLGAEGAVLVPRTQLPNYEAAGKFCHAHLEADLRWRESARWYAVKGCSGDCFSRAGDYLMAVFILGNIVRYSPEQMLEASRSESELAWVLRRVLQAAERFFPQLMLNWVYGVNMYFE